MTGRDDSGAEPPACGFEELVSRAAARGLNRLRSRAGERGGIDVSDIDRAPNPRGERAAERFVFVRLAAAQTVIEVHETRQRDTAGRGHLVDQPRQRDRIRAAGHGHGHALTGLQKLPALEATQNAPRQGRHGESGN